MKRVIVANSNQCRIYDYQRPSYLNLIKEIAIPENRLRNIDLASDRPGRYATGGLSRSAYEETSLKDVHVDNFARTLALEVDHERNNHDFDELIVVMSPKMEGLFQHHINKHVKALIKRIIPKNIVTYPLRKLLQFLNNKFIL